MKPDCPIARREAYRVGPCPHAEARALIITNHYAKSAANTSVHAHGLYRVSDGALVGAALWMPPTANAAKALAKRHLGALERHREVLVLSRLVIVSGEPQNCAGLLLGASERFVRRDTRWKLLVTYADKSEGHSGTIYKATNWTFDGETRPEAKWRTPGGRLVSKLATRSRTVADMEYAGYIRSVAVKNRFVKVLDKRANRG